MKERRNGQNTDEPAVSQELIEAYKANPSNPEIITKIWRAFLPKFNIPNCDWPQIQIAWPVTGVKGEANPGLMIPNIAEVQGREGLILLGETFPLMGSHDARATSIVSSDILPVWVKTEANIATPNTYTAETQIEDFLAESWLDGLTKQLYILGSQFSKLTVGRYFDEDGRASRLLGSRGAGVVRARFHSDGTLTSSSGMYPRDRVSDWGARTVQ